MECAVKQMADTRWFYTFTELNGKGESLTIELSKCEDCSLKNSLPKLWKQKGYTSRVLETYWSLSTYVKDSEGRCFGRYNPQHELSEDKAKTVINFDWMFEATEDNREKLINEVCKLFYSAKGETATEEKTRKIKEFAVKNNVDIYTTLPKGWSELFGALTAPIGTTWISNMQPLKSGNRKSAILIKREVIRR